MSTYDVIIPAGGRLDEEFSKVVATNSKALIRFDGRTVLERTITAFRESGAVRRIVVVGSTEVCESAEGASADECLREGATGPENIFRGLDYLVEDGSVSDRVLICTCDLPFIDADVVKLFLSLCNENKDFCVPLIAEPDYSEAYPQAEATFVGLRDGVFTTGCLYNVRPEALRKAIHHIDRLFVNRKSKIGMARVLGMRFVLLLLMKRLTIRDVEDKVHELLGCTGQAVADSPPELAYDVDYLEDYHYAMQTFRTMRKTPSMH
ncbi:MAG: nucleotidyltransferase family protein [Armatimonadetes bacterium]|nr:nucleotidyltransferase family protein [Armatimonadota bacterium]